jgi:hypothetical protein
MRYGRSAAAAAPGAAPCCRSGRSAAAARAAAAPGAAARPYGAPSHLPPLASFLLPHTLSLHGAMMRVLTKYGKSNAVMSPARRPGIGIRRAVSGLRNAPASAATSASIPAIDSTGVSPGNGMVSSPVPHTALNVSRSRQVRNAPPHCAAPEPHPPAPAASRR